MPYGYNRSMEWWHWFTLGAVLLVVDVALVNSNYLLWLGLGAMITGLAIGAVGDLELWLQVAAFAGCSFFFLALWFQVFKPRKDQQVLAKAREQIPGQPASVIRFSNGKGLLRLQRPVGGRDVWKFTCSDQLHSGEQLVVKDIDEQGIASAAKLAGQGSQDATPDTSHHSPEEKPA
jgi:membrane protein implicated in regulation of membrane protease activity